jgi:hypothetical protein
VTDSSGRATSTTATVEVAKDSTIVKTSLATRRKGHFLLVAVDGAGVVRIRSTKVTLKRPGTAKLKIVLSAAAIRTLNQKHMLTIKLTVAYVPVTGPAVSKKLSVVVRG